MPVSLVPACEQTQIDFIFGPALVPPAMASNLPRNLPTLFRMGLLSQISSLGFFLILPLKRWNTWFSVTSTQCDSRFSSCSSN